MMSCGGVSAITSPPSSSSSFNSKSLNPSLPSSPLPLPSSSTSSFQVLNHTHQWRLSLSSPRQNPFPRLSCSSFPTPPGSGDSDSKTVLDAFFLGKALGEALTERIESTVGEFLSTVGRLQAEQQKQIQDFQEDVLERAKRAKDRAAREALEEQGRLIPKSSTTVNAPATNTNGASSSTVPQPNGRESADASNSLETTEDEGSSDQDFPSSIPIDE